MLNIVVPMAGAGSRFVIAGYKDPKPLIPIKGFPMIQVVIENLKPLCDHRFIFICQKSHVDKYELENKLNFWAPNSLIIGIDGVTEGAACTVLLAENLINNNEPLMIANSDQFIDVDINQYLETLSNNDYDGLIMTMKADDSKWSFIDYNELGYISRVVEKEVISDEATVGIYNFRYGKDFVKAAQEMISKDLRVNNEFYVAPVYNQLIESSKKIGFYNIGSENNGMYGLGTPSDLDNFLQRPIVEKALVNLL